MGRTVQKKKSPSVWSRLDPLHSAIRSLAPTQEHGFEGFVRDLFAELTCQPFWLMKSGHQGGVDKINEPAFNGLLVGVEGKHYGDSTRLPLDQLKSKLRDAITEFDRLDVWVLAVTRSIKGGDRIALSQIGARDGVEVLVLDWDRSGSYPPALATLCALAPKAVAQHFKNSSTVADGLEWLRAHGSFAAAKEQIHSRLQSSHIGYASTKIAMDAWLESRMTERHRALIAFDTLANLADPAVIRIPRAQLQQQLDSWWDRDDNPSAVLLGDEGMGKSWAALSWWISRHAQADFPLTVVIPAKFVQTADPVELVAKALCGALAGKDESYWRRRVERWLSDGGPKPAILMIIDGLNQGWAFQDWAELSLRLTQAENQGRAALLMTCRPDHFDGRLRGIDQFSAPPLEIRVSKFTDEELDARLAAADASRAEFGRELLELLRVPRLCNLALVRRKELKGSGDVTLERLIYEDWRFRSHQAQKRMTDAEFKAFIAALAREEKVKLADKRISRRQLLQRLTEKNGESESAYEGVLSELVDGGWMSSSAGAPHEFKVNPARLPYAIGLALLDELKDATTVREARAVLDSALDPYQGMDVAVSIVRCATSFAMIEPVIPHSTKQALLAYWLKMQNFSAKDFDAFWPCIGCAPNAVLDTAEEFWFQRREGSSETEALVKGFANAHHWPEVMAACEERLTQWFCGYWLDPLVGEVLGNVTDDVEAKERRAETRARANQCGESGLGAAFDLALVEVPAEGRAWGCYRAIELMSWLPRAPMTRPILAWAITRAIMGKFRQEDKFAWVLRWNELDPAESRETILSAASRLFQMGGSIARKAARVLLNAFASAEAHRLQADNGAAAHPPSYPDAAAWPITTRRGLASIADVQVQMLSPEQSLPADYLRRIKRALQEVDDGQLQAIATERQGQLSRSLHVLSRWLPDERASLERKAARAVLKELGKDSPAAWALGGMAMLRRSMPLLGERDFDAWREVARRARKEGQDWNWALQLVDLVNQPARVQIGVLERAALDAEFLQTVGGLLAALDVHTAKAVGERLIATDKESELLYWLEYLVRTCPKRLLMLARVDQLFSATSVSVREAAFKLAYRSGNKRIADVLARSDWSIKNAQSESEGIWGSLLLLNSTLGDTEGFLERIEPQLWGTAAENWPSRADYLEKFSQLVESELRRLATANSGSVSHNRLTGRGGWKMLAKAKQNLLKEWMLPIVRPGTTRHSRLFGLAADEQFPFWEAVVAIAPREPDFAAEAACALLQSGKESGIRYGAIYKSAIQLKGPRAKPVRQMVLEEANNDEKLFDYACGLQQAGETPALLEQIETDLHSQIPGHVARGLTLAGFMWPGIGGDMLWQLALEAPASGWLREVYLKARERFQRATWAAYWFEVFRGAPNEEEAFAAFELLLESLDERFAVMKPHQKGTPIFELDWRRRALWGFSLHNLNQRSKQQRSEWAKLFLSTGLPLSNQYPQRT